jgi:hypothetical protein
MILACGGQGHAEALASCEDVYRDGMQASHAACRRASSQALLQRAADDEYEAGPACAHVAALRPRSFTRGSLAVAVAVRATQLKHSACNG